MNQKLKSLNMALHSVGCCSEAELIKLAFINQAKILYSYDSYGAPRVILSGLIKDKVVKFGEMYSVKLELDYEEQIFQVHRNIDEEYLGLGYGEEMLAVIAKLAQTNDGNIAIIPWGGSIESDHAVKSVKSMIRGRSGIELIPVCIVEVSEEHEPILFKRADVDSAIQKIEWSTGIKLSVDKVKKLKSTIQRVELGQNEYNFNGMRYSMGYIVKNTGAKISLPIQLEGRRKSEDNYDLQEERDKRARAVKYIRNPELKEKDDKRKYDDMMSCLNRNPSNFLYFYGTGEEPYAGHKDLADMAAEKCIKNANPLELKHLLRATSEYPILAEYQERFRSALIECSSPTA